MVATPHAQGQSLARAGVPLLDFMANNVVNVPHMFNTIANDQCFAIPMGGLLLYVKKKYNTQRRRQELECISLTPSHHVHTRTKSFAKTIEAISKPSSDGAFPQWFDNI
jgi:hypothetical protein|tara:strand:- start:6930 stop:7256 length:327 start_codon:yes stop_codon:yes gene_type:complete